MSLSKKRLFLGATALAAAAALVLTGCSSDGSSGNSSGGATTITLFNGSVGNFTENFNPLLSTGAELQPSQGVLYETLFYYNMARAQKPVPVLGTAYSWNADGTQLTITTRSGVTWTDGQPFTAKDVAFTFTLFQKNPGLNTTGATWTATATNDNTVVLTFPSTSFTLEPQLLGNMAMVPEHIWSKIADPAKETNTSPVGTGPYKLKSFSAQSYVLTRNPTYWGTGDEAPKVENVRYISLANADAATSALESGQIDWMGSYLPTLKNIIKQHPNLSYVNTPDSVTDIVACSNAALGCTGPQTDPAVRQAIYYAMDRTQLNTQAVAGFAEPASAALLVPSVNGDNIVDQANASLPQTADVAKAKSVLEAAGWKLGGNGYYSKGGQELDLSVNVVTGWTDYDTDCTLLQGQLKPAGIKLSVNQVAQNAWSQAEVSGKFQLSLNSINPGASPSPYFIYNNYLSTSNTAKAGESATTNVSRYSNPTVDAAIKDVASTNDPAKQKVDYGVIQAQIVKDMPYIPIYVNQALTQFNNSRATGWPTQDNLYAFPEPWKAWDNGIVLKAIRPAKG
ncbi:ABC transporter substrate-binding protein [Rugosimonospora acidiphila]|uniref:ABC transporter substrate-binding protein n=1 Tax=Rugosimonospora acidiphila TaxID=556531 RepID=A0ABP9STR7_9ACTN